MILMFYYDTNVMFYVKMAIILRISTQVLFKEAVLDKYRKQEGFCY